MPFVNSQGCKLARATAGIWVPGLVRQFTGAFFDKRHARLGPQLGQRKFWRPGRVDTRKSFDADAVLRRVIAQERSLTRCAWSENPGAGHRSSCSGKPRPKRVDRPKVNAVLLRRVARGYAWWDEIRSGRSTFKEIVKRENLSWRFVAIHLDLAFLAPIVVSAIIEGQQGSSLSAQDLRSTQIPLEWQTQKQWIGTARYSVNSARNVVRSRSQ